MSDPRTRAYYRVGSNIVSVVSGNERDAEAKWTQQKLPFKPVHRAGDTWADGADPRIAREKEDAATTVRRAEASMGDIGAVEAGSKRFGQGALAGAGVKLAAASDGFQNWVSSKSPGMVDPLTGDPAVTQGRGMDAPLKGRADFEREHKARLSQGDAQQPVASTVGAIGGSAALGAALPVARAAPGAGLLRNAVAGAANVGIDAASGAVQAANEAPEGYAKEDALRAFVMSGGVSTAMRAPKSAAVGARSARDAAVSTLAPEVVPAARTLTDISPEGARMRQAAREGAENLDPQVRRTAAAIDRAEIAADSVRHEMRSADFKRKDVEDAFAREMTPDVPKGDPALRPHRGIEDMDFEIAGEPVHVKAQVESVTDARAQGQSVPAGPTSRRKRAQLTEQGVVDAPEAAPMTRAIPPPPRQFDPVVAVASGMGIAEQMRNELTALVATYKQAGANTPGALVELSKRAEALVNKLAPHLKSSSDPAANVRAATDAYLLLDDFKRTLGSRSKNLGRDGRFAQQSLRSMYMDTLRPHLEDATVWGAQVAREQKDINARWTPWLNERERFERTVLSPDAVRPAADTFERVKDADRGKVQGILSRAGTAAGDTEELSLREGLRTSADLVEQASRMTGAGPALKENAAGVRRDADIALQELDTSKANRTAMREARDVAQASPRLGRIVNATSATEAAVRNSPALSATARALGATRAGGQTRQVATRATASYAGMSRESASEADAMADPKYGQLITQKPQSERAFTIGVLNSQDPEFRARQRDAARKRTSANER